jgi:hypothetical protein
MCGRRLGVAAVAVLALGGCSPTGPQAQGAVPKAGTTTAAATPATTTASPTTTDRSPGGPLPAASGTAASSQRKTFVPKRIRLLSSGGVAASIRGVDAGAGGVLELPRDPGDVGFWVGGSLAGELFGSVVLAGHIDSRQRGVGFFARLLDVEPGDRVELSGDGVRLTYVVRSNREVPKGVLATDAEVFDRRAPGRLVLITCTGTFDPRTRHYDHNLVVLAEPQGAPRAG